MKEGDIVTFCFNTLTKDGKPNRAQVVRKRHDCSWSEIVEIYQKDLQTEKDKAKEKEKPKRVCLFINLFVRIYLFIYLLLLLFC